MALKMQGTSGESSYYGIGKFVERSKLQDEPTQRYSFQERTETKLEPGTLMEDKDFEELTDFSSEWAIFVRGLFPQEAKQQEIKKTIRFYGFLCQWVSAIIIKAGLDPKDLKKSRLAPFLSLPCDITSKVIQNIDGKDGKGSMVLLRCLKQVLISLSDITYSTVIGIYYHQFFPKDHGKFYKQVIKELRDALGLHHVFSVGIDIDSKVKLSI